MVNVVVDKERSEQETIKNSIVGKLIISEYICSKCGCAALDTWTKCIQCGHNQVIKKPVPTTQ